MWDVFCFAQNCAIIGFWTILILLFSAFFTWRFIFHGWHENGRRNYLLGIVTFLLATVIQVFFLITIYHWPSFESKVLMTVCFLFVGCFFWEKVLEPIRYKILDRYKDQTGIDPNAG